MARDVAEPAVDQADPDLLADMLAEELALQAEQSTPDSPELIVLLVHLQRITQTNLFVFQMEQKRNTY